MLVSSSNVFIYTYSTFRHIQFVLVNTIKLSKPEKGKMLEEMIVRMAQGGQFRGQISEKELIGILESINQQMPKSNSTVKFDRRRAAIDSDDDEL